MAHWIGLRNERSDKQVLMKVVPARSARFNTEFGENWYRTEYLSTGLPESSSIGKIFWEIADGDHGYRVYSDGKERSSYPVFEEFP